MDVNCIAGVQPLRITLRLKKLAIQNSTLGPRLAIILRQFAKEVPLVLKQLREGLEKRKLPARIKKD